jgi:hypothetical protein
MTSHPPVGPENPIQRGFALRGRISASSCAMLAFLQLCFVANLFRSRRRLEVENLFLRHQLNIALRGAPHRLAILSRTCPAINGGAFSTLAVDDLFPCVVC